MTRRQWELAAWTIGSLGLAGAAIGWMVAPDSFPHAWLAALTAWLGWPIGCMGLLLIHALTGGRWGYVTRSQLVAGMSTLLLLPPALIPLAIVLPSLHPWLRPEVAAHLDNIFYLNLPAFVVRGAVYLIVWFGLAWLILAAFRRDERDHALARIAPAGLILLAITVTFATIDAIMSLDPHFASSVFGLIMIAEMGLLALSVSIFAVIIGQPLEDDALPSLGRLLLALLILWAYLDFMQLLIVWQSDLPQEAAWYAIRLTGGWGAAASLIAGGHFILPFFVLLSSRAQRSRSVMACVTALLILGAIVRSWWLVMPASGANFSLVAVAAMLGVTGIASALALRTPLMPWIPCSVWRHV